MGRSVSGGDPAIIRGFKSLRTPRGTEIFLVCGEVVGPVENIFIY